jgi:DNA-binding NarL/FixJ family response regulator
MSALRSTRTVQAQRPVAAARTRIVVHATLPVERIAVQSILAGQRQFDVSADLVRPGLAGRRSPDVLVWVGGGQSAEAQITAALAMPQTLVVLREISAVPAVASLRAGAAGLACLGCHLDELPQAVASIAAGLGWFAPCVARMVADHLAGRASLREADSRGLTPRELLVLRSIAKGEDNMEVAHDLGIDVRTVKFHASNIYRKLGARHRSEAVSLAYRLGLIA